MESIKNIPKPVIKTELPGPKSQKLLRMEDQYVPKGVFHTVPTFIHRGEGAVIEDIDGNILIDFAAGISVLNIGYSHPEVVEVVKEQAEKYFHTSFSVVFNEPYVYLAKKLCEITPGKFPKKTTFFNCGAEAVENAIKIARQYTKKTDIICFEGAYHGRTLLTMTLTSKSRPYTFGFGPFAPGVYKIPFASCYRCAYGLKRETCNLRCAERLEEIFASVVDAENVAAVIAEPIQGEGGFSLPPDEFFTRIKEICEKYNILLIADEIQTGFCRTGKMFASEYWSVVPDIVTMSKSLAAGLPLSALTARTEIIETPQVGQIGGTFCGNPVASVAALKVIEIMERDHYAEKAQRIGEMMKPRFENMKEKYEIIGDVRGRGAMMAFELVKDRKTKLPAKDETKMIQKLAYENGIILLSAGIYSNVIRTLVPLVITEEQLNSGLDIIEKAVAKVNENLKSS